MWSSRSPDSVAEAAALEREHVQSGVGEFLGDDRGGQAEADQDDIDRWKFRRHHQPPRPRGCARPARP